MRIVAATLAILAAGCGSFAAEREPDPTPRGSPARANVVLYVSNQSFERPTVDIRVEVDGRIVVDDEFPVEGQHNWVEFRLELPAGKHTLRAETQAGDATTTRTFRVKGRRWAVLDYWCCDDASDPKFTFEVSKKRIAFA